MIAGFTFLALRLLDLGGQASDVALSAGLSAVAEIPAMAVIPRVVARTGSRALLVAGIVLYGPSWRRGRSWTTLPSSSRPGCSRGIAYAAIAISAVMTIAALLPAELQGTGQGLYQTVGYGVAAVVANSVGGLVYGSGGALPLFLGCAVLAALGAAVAWRSVPSRTAAPSVRSSAMTAPGPLPPTSSAELSRCPP